MFSFRARAEKGIARHIDVSSVVGTYSNFSLVRSEHAHASYPGLDHPRRTQGQLVGTGITCDQASLIFFVAVGRYA